MDDRGFLVDDIEQVQKEFRKNFFPVPDHLREAARQKLAGEKTAQVRLNADGELSEWRKELATGKAAQRRLRQRERLERA